MDRDEAISRLQSLLGQDLRRLADSLDITVWNAKGNLNKGWAGQTVERFLGIPLNSSQSPNLGTWELKVVPLRRKADGSYSIKETMAITMLDPWEVSARRFEDSHLLMKLGKIIAVSRVYEDKLESQSICANVNAFELEGTELYNQVIADYDLIRATIDTDGFDALTGKIGKYIQPRTKGQGHGSTSRAFYARKELVEYIIGRKKSRHVAGVSMSEDCTIHAGKLNIVTRKPLDGIMARLPANQSGAGRHKCPYCAYRVGYEDALAEIVKSVRQSTNLSP